MEDFEMPDFGRYLIIGFTIVISLVIFLSAIYSTLYRGVKKGPTLIEAVISGDVSVDMIQNIQIIKAQPGVWEFTEDSYNRLKRKTVTDPKIIERFIIILKFYTKKGRTHRNHPSFLYKSYMKIELTDGNVFYLIVETYNYRNHQYCSIDSLYRNTRNPNGGLHYENKDLVFFMKKYDPWFAR